MTRKKASRAEGGKAARRRQRTVSSGRWRGIAFGLVALSAIALAGYFLWPVLRGSGGTASGATSIQLSMAGFAPSHIEAQAGQPVTVRLINKDNRFHTDGGGWHQFASDELGFDVKVKPLGNELFTFTPEKAGTYNFYCDVCCGGRANPAMAGTIVVEG